MDVKLDRRWDSAQVLTGQKSPGNSIAVKLNIDVMTTYSLPKIISG